MDLIKTDTNLFGKTASGRSGLVGFSDERKDGYDFKESVLEMLSK